MLEVFGLLLVSSTSSCTFSVASRHSVESLNCFLASLAVFTGLFHSSPWKQLRYSSQAGAGYYKISGGSMNSSGLK